MEILDLRRRIEESVLEVRGDGKAGGGLVLAFQSLAALMLNDPRLHVLEWPFFSSARRGANIRSFVRVSAAPIAIACEITRPWLVLLMDEVAAKSSDFAAGVPAGGTFVLNTTRSPAACACHFGLAGRVITVPGDEIGMRHLKHPIGNVSAYVALAHAIGGFSAEQVERAFVQMLEKRRIPPSLVDKNRAAIRDSAVAIRSGAFDEAGECASQGFAGYGDLPVGAQSALRLSLSNRTSDYARGGLRLRFEDPQDACTGCAHCITNCPEGIIRFLPDAGRVLKVTGVDVSTYCKLCGECIAICPEKLFCEVPYEETWEEETTS
jgi:2-oxoacid:acceptor oxidoreductase gamma subunit (pyruvate/2-ketoisovalerate family)